MSLSRVIVWIVVLALLITGIFMLINRGGDYTSDTSSLAGTVADSGAPESVIDSTIVPETDDVSVGEII